MFRFLREKYLERFDEHMMEIIRGAGITFMLKAFGAGLQFFFSVVLARALGADGAGVYYLALTICTVAWTIGCFGLQTSLLRFIASHASKLEWAAVKGVYQKTMALGSLVSLVLSLLLFLAAPQISVKVFAKPELVMPLRWLAVAVWPMTLIVLNSEALKGLKHIRDSQFIGGVLVPLLALVGLCVIGDRFGVMGAVGVYGIAAALTAVFAVFVWRLVIPKMTKIGPHFSTSLLLESCLPMLWVTICQMVIAWSSTFALGIWGTKAEVGVFSVAVRTANLISFILVSVNSIAAPKFAELHSRGDMVALSQIARKSALMMICFASPVLLMLIIAPGWVMGLFGPEFVDSGYLLTIIAVGQFVNVATGSVGYLLVMSGRERLMRNNTFFVAIMAVALNLALVPAFGALGAAVSTMICMILVNAIAFYLVKRDLGIITVPWYSSKRKNK